MAVVGDYIYFNGGEISSYKYGIQDKDADEDSYASASPSPQESEHSMAGGRWPGR